MFEHRGRAGSAMAFVGFDVLHVAGQDVMREPWRDRRKRLEDIAASETLPGVAIVPTTNDAGELWDLWVIRSGGEGIVLKEPVSHYHPGIRSPAWLKVKARLTLVVTVTGGDGERIAWGTGARRSRSNSRTRIRAPARQSRSGKRSVSHGATPSSCASASRPSCCAGV